MSWLFVRNAIKAHKGEGYLRGHVVVVASQYTEFEEKKSIFRWEDKGDYMRFSTNSKDANYARTSFAVEQHPHSDKHLLLKVTAKGRVFACASAWEEGDDDNPKPTTSAVQYLWRHNRQCFLPYNEAAGCFI